MSILVVGDANADLIAQLGRYPAEGGDSGVRELDWSSGGAGVNVAAGLALLGASCRLVARVGVDPAAAVALRAARAAGADMRAVQIDPAVATGICFAAVSPGGERTFFSFRGANAALEAGAAIQPGVGWLHICGHALLEGRQRETSLALLREAAARGVPASLDLCLPLIHNHRATLPELLPLLHTLFANEAELAALTSATEDTEHSEVGRRSGVDGANNAEPQGRLSVRSVVSVANQPRLVVKLGARGCALGDPAQAEVIPAFAVEAVDTTACGDAFVAGFVRAHLLGAPPRDCATFGNAMGALVATRAGAADVMPSRAELRAFLTARAPELLPLLGQPITELID